MREIAIVTGAASGIGYAVVDHLLERNPELRCAGADLTTGWSSELGGRHGSERLLEVGVDVRDPVAVERAVETVTAELGVPTQLVNCAGVQLNCAALDLTPKDWRRVLGVNLDGTFFFCQAAGRRMCEARRGAIVNIASSSVHFGLPRRLPYVTSKTAILGLTNTLAVEWGPYAVRVNAVAPGYVETKLLQDAFEAGHVDRSKVEAESAANRLARPDEIALAVGFLLSDEAGFITGELLNVDGGFRVKKG